MTNLSEAIALALEHYQEGRLQEADSHCRQILQFAPKSPDALHILGVIAHQTGRNDLALQYLEEAIKLSPASAEMHNSLAEAYRAQGQFDRAAAHFRHALGINPSMAEAHCNLGIVLRLHGSQEEAVSHFQQAIQLKPSLAQAHNNLGSVYFYQGRVDEAINEFRSALSFLPNLTEALTNLTVALRSKGQAHEALNPLFSSLAAQPTNVSLRLALAEALRGISLSAAGERERAILANLCDDEGVSTLDLAHAIVGLLKASPALIAVLGIARDDKDPFLGAATETISLTGDRLLLAALPRMTIHEPDVELAMTSLRRSMLFRLREDGTLTPPDFSMSTDFPCALARHCFLTEYAFFVKNDEAKEVTKLRARVQARLEQPISNARALEQSLIAVALYDPLIKLLGWERLLGPMLTSWSKPFQHVLRQHLFNRQREKELATNIAAITPIADTVSHAVREQYEDNPYPIWVSVIQPRPAYIEELAQRLVPNRPPHTYRRPVQILVAGCGSGHHPIQVARTYRDCEVLAVDLSRASLAYGARMAEHFGVANLTFSQADILELGRIGRTFAMIECAGVLHHMHDPMKGWRILASLLEPRGLMKIGLYSARARQEIKAAREFVRTEGYKPNPNGIRKCRRAIMELPDGNPVRGVLTFGDFFSLNGCRDLIMHVQEHVFSLPQIQKCLDDLGLRFLAMDCDSSVLARFQAMFPGKGAETDLSMWDRFEEGSRETFKNMYQFWCCAR